MIIHNRLMLLPIIIIVVAIYKVVITATAEFMNGFAMDCLYVPSHAPKNSWRYCYIASYTSGTPLIHLFKRLLCLMRIEML